MPAARIPLPLPPADETETACKVVAPRKPGRQAVRWATHRPLRQLPRLLRRVAPSQRMGWGNNRVCRDKIAKPPPPRPQKVRVGQAVSE